MTEKLLFNEFLFPSDTVADIRRVNPWWENKPVQELPITRRHLVEDIKNRLNKSLAPIVVVRGPRQVGKTTAQLHIIEDLLDSGIDPRRIFRVQFDDLQGLEKIASQDPILRMVDWYEKNILKETLNEVARSGRKVYLFFDEVQNLANWAPQLKNLVDHSTAFVVVTGSSALRIEMGRDSLAGRITTIESGVLSLTEIAKFNNINLGPAFWKENGLEIFGHKEFWAELRLYGQKVSSERDKAFKMYSQRGGYPLAHKNVNIPWANLADQLNETVIKRVIQHDLLRVGGRGRKRDAALLEEVFRMACRYAGQTPSFFTLSREVQRVLSANIGPLRINHYIRFLSQALLLRLIEPLEIRLKKKKGSPKICLIDHSLRASWLQEIIPMDPDELLRYPHLSVLAGRIAESTTGAVLSTISGLDLCYVPERGNEPEVDFVVTIGVKRIPIEVKYQRSLDTLSDTEGLRAFIEKAANKAAFGLLITQVEDVKIVDPRIIALPLSTLMLLK